MKIKVIYNVKGEQFIFGISHYKIQSTMPFECQTAEEIIEKYPPSKKSPALMNAINELINGERTSVTYRIDGLGIGNSRIEKC